MTFTRIIGTSLILPPCISRGENYSCPGRKRAQKNKPFFTGEAIISQPPVWVKPILRPVGEKVSIFPGMCYTFLKHMGRRCRLGRALWNMPSAQAQGLILRCLGAPREGKVIRDEESICIIAVYCRCDHTASVFFQKRTQMAGTCAADHLISAQPSIPAQYGSTVPGSNGSVSASVMPCLGDWEYPHHDPSRYLLCLSR